MIDGTLCAAFICTTISAGWVIKTKATCEQNYDFVWLYQTWFYNLITPITLISQLVVLIINWVNASFISSFPKQTNEKTERMRGMIVAPFFIPYVKFSSYMSKI
ncbi:MAG: hypothetical protein IJM12_02390 [Bacteroidales bacterium]|nr:hypothetical protein [Bacteroidales bacterium]